MSPHSMDMASARILLSMVGMWQHDPEASAKQGEVGDQDGPGALFGELMAVGFAAASFPGRSR